MFLLKALLSISIVLLVFSLVNCDDEESQRRNKIRYKYNHPPAAENAEPIPVSIVYDKVIDRSSRQYKSPEVTENTSRTPEPKKPEATTEVQQKTLSTVYDKIIDRSSRQYKLLEVSETTKSTPQPKELEATTEVQQKKTPKEEPTTTTEDTGDIAVKTVSKSKQIEPKFFEKELQIPVAIVYDQEPAVIKSNRARSGERGVRKQRRRPVKPTDESVKAAEPLDIKDVKTTTTSKPEFRVKETAKEITSSKPQVTQVKAQVEPSKIDSESMKITKRVRERDPVVPIVESENRVFSHSGQFAYSYESGDGTKAYSTGELKTVDKDMAGEAVVGGFSYKDKDGMDISLSYTADENGYRPVGAHLPTPPPIPAAIARALKYLATKTTPEPVTEATDSN